MIDLRHLLNRKKWLFVRNKMFKYIIIIGAVLFSSSALSVQCGIGRITDIHQSYDVGAGEYYRFEIAIDYSVANSNGGIRNPAAYVETLISVNSEESQGGLERLVNLRNIAQLALATGSVVELWSHMTSPPFLADNLCEYIDEITIFK